MDITCIHELPHGSGLCAACQADYDVDPQAWVEYGQHPDGIARYEALLEEIAAEAAVTSQQTTDPSIPF